MRVLPLPGLLQVVQQPADVMVGVRQEPRVHLGHPAEQPLLLRRQRIPRPGDIQRRERLALGPLAGLRRADRVDRRQLGVGRDDAQLLLPGQRLLPDRLVPHVEAALELVGPFLRDMVRRMGRAGRVVQEERLVRRDRLGVLDELQRLVGQVLGQVIALGRGLRLVHRVVVIDQVRIPLVGLRPQEPVPALEPPPGRPVPPRGGDVHLDRRAQVPLADHVGVPARARPGSRAACRSPAGSSRWRSGTRPAASVMHAIELRVWLRPVSRHDRVGEHSAVVCHCV